MTVTPQPLTGQDLLDQLRQLSPEELARPVLINDWSTSEVIDCPTGIRAGTAGQDDRPVLWLDAQRTD